MGKYRVLRGFWQLEYDESLRKIVLNFVRADEYVRSN